MPDFLFEIEYSDPANAKFYETKGDRDLIYAFHGSRLENFHSILHNGLHCHLNKVGLLLLTWGGGGRAGQSWGGLGRGRGGASSLRPCAPSAVCRPAAAAGSL